MTRARALACATIAGVIALAMLLGGGGATVEAQTAPSATPRAGVVVSEAQALAVEKQLLCPVCTNERLDVCSTAVCTDMKRVIRERLAQGSTPDDIILYFETRYGPEVRADLPRSGFNLLLFGWVGGAIVLMAGAAALALASMHRGSRRRASAPATAEGAPPDDRWLDAQLDEADPGAVPPSRPSR